VVRYYQYWLGAKVVKGPMKQSVIAELLQHAGDELRHADMVATRIIQLGGSGTR
jgi:bacterioferritin